MLPVVKVGTSRQVVIPKEIWNELQLEAGDFFEVEIEDARLVFTPKKLLSKDELWYWSKEGQREMQQALREVADGKTMGFDDVEDLIRDLKRK